MKFFIVDAFSNKPFGGNPAGVVVLDSNAFPDEEMMQRIATELRFSETAFVRCDGIGEFTLRYFTPKAEVDLCGHATIASFSLLHRKGLVAGQCLCHTKAGNLQIHIDQKVMMQTAAPHIVATISETDVIYRALGLLKTPSVQNLPVQVVSTGLPDIMIPIPDVATLNAILPDLEAISALTKRLNAVSFHLFAFADDSFTAHVRDFAPLFDIPEESATGTANASLSFYLRHCGCIGSNAHCSFLQGEAMGRPSVVDTRILPDGNILVGGTATVVAEGNLMV